MNARILLTLVVAALLSLSVGCRSALYAAYEKVGVYKRDLLKKRVVAARDEEKAAGEQFKDALGKLRALYGNQNSNLEKAYDQLKGEYDDAASRCEAVRKRIRDMETVAADLFKEWEEEIKQISTDSMRTASRTQLRQTQERYQDLHRALRRAEDGMEPVLTKFKDYVLFLKHNLNAQAIASLQGEATNIQNEIGRLIEDMHASIKRADDFIKQMP